MNSLAHAIAMIGVQKLSKICSVTPQAILKWKKRGRLPRTEWTGETDYASRIEKITNGQIKREDLLQLPWDKV